MKRIVIILLVVFYITGCSGDKTKVRIDQLKVEEKTDVSEYDQHVKHFKLEGFSEDGKNKWSVEGDFANIVEPEILLDQIRGNSISDEFTVLIEADDGIYNMNTKTAVLNGNVQITLAEEGKVFMETATWNPNTEQLSSTSLIEIVHNGVIIRGIGGIVKVQDEWARLDKDIKLTDEEGRIITCDGPLEVIYKENKAILNNNVIITDAQGKMKSDKVVAYFDKDKREIENIEWLGNVEAVY